MKKDCLLPSSLDDLQAELERQGISIQKFFLDENIDPEQRDKILLSALGSEEKVKFFTDTVYEEILTPLLQRKARKDLERENIKQNIVDDMVLNRVRRLQGKMTPQYEGMYLERLVQEDLKLAVTQEQSEALVDAQTSVDNAMEDLNTAIKESEEFKGQNFKDLYKDEDVQKIKANDKLYQKYLTLGLSIVNYNKVYADISQDILSRGAGAVAKKILGSTRSAVLSADLSFGRNISNMFFVSPKTGFKSWWKGAERTFADLWYGTSKDKNGYTHKDYAWAEIYAHPNVVSGRLKQLGVNIGITEEQFLNSYLTQLTEKAEDVSRDESKSGALRKTAVAARPLLRLYAASESGFNMAVNYARFTYANMLIDLYDAKTIEDVKLLKNNGVGDLIMEQTGRWNGLKGERRTVDTLSFYLMAMRWTASRITTAKNIIYAPVTIADWAKGIATGKGIKSLDTFYFNKTNVDKGRASVGIVLGMSLFASLLSAALSEDDDKDYWEKVIEGLDPTQDFGKVVIGKTRFDATFGVASVISTVAKTAKLFLDPQYGKDSWDPIARFLKNRQAPVISIINGAYEHVRAYFDDTYLPKDIMGDPETAGAFIRGMFVPIYIDNMVDYFGEGRDEDVSTLEASAAILADVIGIGATTYSDRMSKAEILEKWGKASPLAQLSSRTNLAQKLSKEEFIEAEKEMEDMYMTESARIINSSAYQSMTKEQKDKALTDLHRRIVDKLSKKYGVSSKGKKKALK